MRTGSEVELMATATELAESARSSTPPNPWVGCVLVRDGEIVGAGATGAYPGGPHAEVAALTAAGDRARGSTAFVTLEPCDHHGNTPPCSEALIAAGVAGVTIALEDPDSRVRGSGAARLVAAGIPVTIGVGADAVAASLAPYLHQRRTGRAFALLKTAMSLDGRTAAADGSSQWITGVEARADAHRLRAESQAVVVGPGTARADRPRLTVRNEDQPDEVQPDEVQPDEVRPDEVRASVRQPLRVLLDAHGRVPAAGPLFDPTLAPTLVITTPPTPESVRDAWQAAGAKVEVLGAGTEDRGVDLAGVLTLLAERYGVLQAMIEGGARLHGAFVAEGLADRLVAYVAPVLLGERGLPVVGFPGPDSLAGAARWQLQDVTRFGADVRIVLDPPAREVG